MKSGLAVERGAGKSWKHCFFPWFWRVPRSYMDLGTRQNHGGLRFFTFRTNSWSKCHQHLYSWFQNRSLTESDTQQRFEDPCWHKVIPNRDFKVQAQENANSLWGVAQNHPRSQKCVRGFKIDLVQTPFETCLGSHRGSRKFKKTHFVCKGRQNQTLFKCIGFYIVLGASQTTPDAFQECDWH